MIKPCGSYFRVITAIFSGVRILRIFTVSVIIMIKVHDKRSICSLLQISYAIGIAEPLSITVLSYGTSHKSENELLRIVRSNFDLRPGKIVK